MKLRWFVPVLVAAAALTLWQTAPRANAEATPTVLRAMATEDQVPGKPVVLSVKLNDNTGKAIGNASVEFFIMTDVFGQRPMSVGKATTDSGGVGMISYKPSMVGQLNVVAKFAGNSQFAATQTNFQFTAVGPARVHQNAEFGLAPIRAAAPIGVFAIVLLVWVVIIAVVVTTVRGLRAPVPEAATRRAEASSLGREATRD